MDLKSLEFVHVDLAEGVALLKVSRPKALNALNKAVLAELRTALEELADFQSLACLILSGDGDKAFVAGADIAEMQAMSPSDAEEFSRSGHQVARMLEEFPVPTIAAVHGYALGAGCELALACDIIYASDKAKFGQPEVKLGLIPGFGGAVRLPRKIGTAAASEWIYTGEVYSAQQAQTLGLVREVVPSDNLLPRANEVAKLIGRRGPLAVRAAKRVIAQGMAADPRRAAQIEQEEFAGLFNTQDMREGTTAFVEKREPTFKGV